MGLFTKGQNAESKEVKLSAALCQRRDALGATWPQVKAAWDKVDESEVMPAAAELSIAQLTANAERILASREKLKKSIWARDGIKADHQRAMDELNAEIETLSGPVVFAKAAEWQGELSNLRTQRIVESAGKFTDFSSEKLGRKIKYRSNLGVIEEAKEVLLGSIRMIREKRQKPLSEIHTFIDEIEGRLKKLDFTVLTESAPVSESVYQQLIQQPELTVVQPGRERYIGVTGPPIGLPGARVGRA